MKLYLVAGSKSDMLKRSLEENQDIEVVYIANSFEEALNHLIRNSLDFDSMLLMDAGIVENTESFTDTLNTLRELMNSSYPNITIKFITKDPVYLNNYNNIVSGDDRFEVYFVDNVRIPISYIQEVCLKNQNKKSSRIQPVEKQVADDSSKTSDEKLTQTLTAKSKTIFGVRLPFFSKSNASEEKLENGETNNSIIGSYVQPKQKISLVSKDFRKVIVVTGCRGAGATSTAANLAIESSAQGLSTILVDMDIQYRGVNLYFPKFGDEVEYNPDLSYSLVRCVIKPDSYERLECGSGSVCSLYSPVEQRLILFISQKSIYRFLCLLVLRSCQEYRRVITGIACHGEHLSAVYVNDNSRSRRSISKVLLVICLGSDSLYIFLQGLHCYFLKSHINCKKQRHYRV